MIQATIPYDYVDISTYSSHIHTQRKYKSSFHYLCGEELNGEGHRFFFREMNTVIVE
jgi:hypothetical protein